MLFVLHIGVIFRLATTDVFSCFHSAFGITCILVCMRGTPAVDMNLIGECVESQNAASLPHQIDRGLFA